MDVAKDVRNPGLVTQIFPPSFPSVGGNAVLRGFYKQRRPDRCMLLLSAGLLIRKAAVHSIGEPNVLKTVRLDVFQVTHRPPLGDIRAVTSLAAAPESVT
jgi:hypothetical protein